MRGVRVLEDKGYRPRAVGGARSSRRERREQRLLPDEVEWKARRRAGLPVEPDRRGPPRHLARHAVRLAPLDTPMIRQGDPVDLLCAAFQFDDEDGNAVLRTHTLRVAFAGWIGDRASRMFDETTAMLPIETLRTLLGHDAADPNSIDLVTDVAIKVRAGHDSTPSCARCRASAAARAAGCRRQRRVRGARLAAAELGVPAARSRRSGDDAVRAVRRHARVGVRDLRDAAHDGRAEGQGHRHRRRGRRRAARHRSGVPAERHRRGGRRHRARRRRRPRSRPSRSTRSTTGSTRTSASSCSRAGCSTCPRSGPHRDAVGRAVAAFAITLALVVAFVPARKAARMNPITALSFE